MKIERPLDEIEMRVLGSLLEKQQSTPDYYPLTLGALRSACNQSTSREPVMSLEQTQINGAIERLQEMGLVWRVHGSRTDKYEHNVDRKWEVSPEIKAILTLLLLRGPQTPGELRSRSERLHPFSAVAEVDAALEAEANAEEPLVRELGRLPGQKEARWTHLIGGEDSATVAPAPEHRVAESLTSRVDELESLVEQLRDRLQRLEQQLGVDG